jgi:hypothetical protein
LAGVAEVKGTVKKVATSKKTKMAFIFTDAL